MEGKRKRARGKKRLFSNVRSKSGPHQWWRLDQEVALWYSNRRQTFFHLAISHRVFCVIGFSKELDTKLWNGTSPKKAQFFLPRLGDQPFLR